MNATSVSFRAKRITCMLMLFTLGICAGYAFAHVMFVQRRDSVLADAFLIAERSIDQYYGKGVFARGFRRVLQDGDKDYYTFQVKAETESVRTNILVNVDMTKMPSRVDFDYAAGYSFKGEFAF